MVVQFILVAELFVAERAEEDAYVVRALCFMLCLLQLCIEAEFAIGALVGNNLFLSLIFSEVDVPHIILRTFFNVTVHLLRFDRVATVFAWDLWLVLILDVVFECFLI